MLETLSYHTVKTRSLYLTWSWNGTRTWRTDRRTDRITV